MSTQPKRRKKRKISFKKSFLIILTLGIIAIASLYFAFFQPSFVSPKQFEKYAQTLISNYNQSLNFFHLETFGNFDFYSNKSYNVTSFLSSNFGTAIVFIPSETWSFETVNTTQRVEDAIFGPTNSLLPTKFIFEGEETGFTASVNSNISFVNIGMLADVGSNVLFKNVNINSVHYYCLIIKGSNESRYWDNNAVMKDSGRIFDADLYFALNRSEDVRMRYYEPELSTLLLDVLKKWNQALNSSGEITYTFSQKEHDIRDIEELARTKYGITNSSQFIQSLLDYLSYVSLPPPKTILNHIVDDPDNWLYVAFLGGLPICIVVTYLAFDYLRKTLRSKVLGYILSILLGILVVALGDVVLGFPYDYQFFSVQTLVVALVWIGGSLAVYKIRKSLLLWRIRKQNGSDSPRNKSQQKNKKSE